MTYQTFLPSPFVKAIVEIAQLFFLTKFNQYFSLQQGIFCDLFVVNPKLITLMTSVFLTTPLPIEACQQIPTRGRFFGLSGAGTSRNLKVLNPTSRTDALMTLSERLPDFVDGFGRASTVEKLSYIVQGLQRRSETLVRPAK